jgi:hypothetical protein
MAVVKRMPDGTLVLSSPGGLAKLSNANGERAGGAQGQQVRFQIGDYERWWMIRFCVDIR